MTRETHNSATTPFRGEMSSDMRQMHNITINKVTT